jgi:hypothetical protein
LVGYHCRRLAEKSAAARLSDQQDWPTAGGLQREHFTLLHFADASPLAHRGTDASEIIIA